MNTQLLKISAVIVGATLALACGAAAQDNADYPRVVNPTPTIYLTWNLEDSSMNILAYAGCVSGGAKKPRSTFNADIDHATKTIEIKGRFAYTLYAPYRKKNCGPTLRDDMMIKNIPLGQYSVMLNGHKIETLNLQRKSFTIKLSNVMTGQYDIRWYDKSIFKTQMANDTVNVVGPFLSRERPYVPYGSRAM